MVSVIRRHWPALAAVALATAVASAQPAGKDQQRRSQVLARYQGGRITLGELEDEINQQSHYVRKRFLLPDQRQAALEQRVRFELLSGEALRRGYNRNAEVLDAVKKSAVQAMLSKEIDEKITPDSISQVELEKYYQDNLPEFVRPETRRVNQIVLETRQEALALIPKARQADLAAFRELAREHSIDQETRLRGGDLFYFDAEGKRREERKPAVDPAIVKAAFALGELGDVAEEPVQIEDGWSVIKLTGHRPESKRPLQGVEATIRRRLWREKRERAVEQLVADLRKEYKPEVQPELVEAIDIKTGPPGENLRPGFPRAPRPRR
jgi:peptidyl-prolyl cis-trans isomerase C